MKHFDAGRLSCCRLNFVSCLFRLLHFLLTLPLLKLQFALSLHFLLLL